MREGVVTGDLFGDKTRCMPYFFAPCAHHVESAKYPACTGEKPTPRCKKQCIAGYPKSYKEDKHHGKNAYGVRGEAKMMAEVSTNGSIEIAVSVYEDFLAYKSGVYTHTTGQFLGDMR